MELDELTERRRHLADRHRALERQLEQQWQLRRQSAKAAETLTDLTAFCQRIQDRLDSASFAERQAMLQFVIEYVIVHEDRLEIRHVIPLHSPPPGLDRPEGPHYGPDG